MTRKSLPLFVVTVCVAPFVIAIVQDRNRVIPDTQTGAVSYYQSSPAQAAPTNSRARRDLLEQVEIYAPINALAGMCALRAPDLDASSAMLKGAKADPEAEQLVGRLHREARAAYDKAADKAEFCHAFLTATFGNATSTVKRTGR